MFSFLVATSVAFSSVSVDGIFSKRGSCANGSCSAPAPVAAKPVVKEKKEAPKASCAGAGSCTREHRHHRVLGLRRGCRG